MKKHWWAGMMATHLMLTGLLIVGIVPWLCQYRMWVGV
jgi:hypothetical protein